VLHRILLAVGLAAGVSGLALPAVAEGSAQAWEQEAVTALAAELVGAVNGLRDSMRRDAPPDTRAGAQSRLRFRLLDRLRLIEAEARALQRALAGGASQDETFHIFRRIDELRRDAADDARRMFVPEGTTQKMEAARAVLEKLRPYYEPAEPPTD
jgi:hypothetical protein